MADDCGQPDAVVRSYVDGELAGRDREAYERHLGRVSAAAG